MKILLLISAATLSIATLQATDLTHVRESDSLGRSCVRLKTPQELKFDSFCRDIDLRELESKLADQPSLNKDPYWQGVRKKIEQGLNSESEFVRYGVKKIQQDNPAYSMPKHIPGNYAKYIEIFGFRSLGRLLEKEFTPESGVCEEVKDHEKLAHALLIFERDPSKKVEMAKELIEIYQKYIKIYTKHIDFLDKSIGSGIFLRGEFTDEAKRDLMADQKRSMIKNKDEEEKCQHYVKIFTNCVNILSQALPH